MCIRDSGAANAGTAATHGPGTGAGVTEQDTRAVGVGFRPLAAQFVEAVALAVSFIAELDGETPGIEVRTTLAVLVDQARVSEFRPTELIDGGQRTEGQEVHHRGPVSYTHLDVYKRQRPGIAWIPTDQKVLDPSPHLARSPRFLDLPAVDFDIHTQVAFDSGDRINRDSLRHCLVSW